MDEKVLVNILIDIIDDGALAYAMHLLFEVRLGHTLYWPKGKEWVENGYYCKELEHLLDRNTEYSNKWDWHFKTITLPEFLNMKDSFKATLTLTQFNDWGPFDKLRKDHAPHIKHIRHIGNPSEDLRDPRFHPGVECARNILLSIMPTDIDCHNFTNCVIKQNRNYVFAHQEFNLEHFKFKPAVRYNRITGFQHDLCSTASYLPLWQPIQSILTDFEWRFHGHAGTDGDIEKGTELGQAFGETTFVLQLKNHETCGGHLTHNAFATGRPLICKKSFYRGMMLDMLVDGVTCIDLDQRSPQENAEFIRYCSEPSRWQQMSQSMHNIYEQYCNYADEAKNVEQFINTLQ